MPHRHSFEREKTGHKVRTATGSERGRCHSRCKLDKKRNQSFQWICNCRSQQKTVASHCREVSTRWVNFRSTHAAGKSATHCAFWVVSGTHFNICKFARVGTHFKTHGWTRDYSEHDIGLMPYYLDCFGRKYNARNNLLDISHKLRIDEFIDFNARNWACAKLLNATDGKYRATANILMVFRCFPWFSCGKDLMVSWLSFEHLIEKS